ncbi:MULTISPECIES: EscI/YscI/HrpB family type III secretion system inner rod protein [unclassified Pseudomonas]|uniref:EscI/YscI/HrpB family type III secretion system inner rod protein n=1 Tax=unclassified Pseudomonas TaxID=196821 RepID=UPI0011EE49A7|nr:MULTISPECIES: EscI/YscI/HrpB family type III secretion system inner rod protein [unclassified Pseudomonas]KAA0947054.1 hypothetical protein FQ182_11960 [Pseudomonas sp. ANT_H4]KAA0953595.1 hypothetical protein FQ186_06185 [Pseudomonas sp. ANT_H14]
MLGNIKIFSSSDPLHNSTGGPELSSSATDINFFNARLTSDKLPATSMSTAMAPNLLSEQSNQLIGLRSQVARSLREISRGSNPSALRDYGSQLSDAQLQTVLTVKTLNKAVQALEKLTNLQ